MNSWRMMIPGAKDSAEAKRIEVFRRILAVMSDEEKAKVSVRFWLRPAAITTTALVAAANHAATSPPHPTANPPRRHRRERRCSRSRRR